MRRRNFLLGAAASHALPGMGQDSRLALVIGNGSYHSGPLKNPMNDARAVAAALRKVGFDVIARENASLQGMIAALQEFSVRARQTSVRLFYFAGHGVQVRGRNYLVPVDAELSSEDDVPRTTADLGDLLERLGELRYGMNIVILDACRTNPFNLLPAINADGRRIRGSNLTANQAYGLARVDAPNGTLVAYSTAPGTVAIDGGRDANSVYTKHLVANIGVAGLPIEQLFKRVRIAVARETQQLQVPWESSSLTGDFCFAVDPGRVCGSIR